METEKRRRDPPAGLHKRHAGEKSPEKGKREFTFLLVVALYLSSASGYRADLTLPWCFSVADVPLCQADRGGAAAHVGEAGLFGRSSETGQRD